MRKLLQINITANWGSHGKIAEGIGMVTMQYGWESHIAYGRWANPSNSKLYRIGSKTDEYLHGMASRLLDNHGLMSQGTTRKLIQYINTLQPDIIHLHNIHGYYLNYPLLFKYLETSNIPIVWTLHDCWSFTGHCAHYMYMGCEKWKTHCRHCPQRETYPKSWLFDRSEHNFKSKKHYFLSVKNMTIVPVCQWLEEQVKQSFFKDRLIHKINNGIDIKAFHPETNPSWIYDRYQIPRNKKIILGVASSWYRKGLDDFARLSAYIAEDYAIVLVGLKKHESKLLRDKRIIKIGRTDNMQELVALYSIAAIYFNPTWEDTFPTTNLEAMACGTPVITYNTGGSPETITPQTGFIVKQGDIPAASDAIQTICEHPKHIYQKACREHVINHFDKNKRFEEYFNLYNNILSNVQHE